jgi:hypothetical protein
MALPSAATKVFLDASTDDPSQARAELATAVDTINALITHLGLSLVTSTPYTLGAGLTAASGAILVDPSVLQNYRAGLTLSNNATDATNDIDVAAGVACDGGNAAFLKLASGLTKRLDAAWAVGTNQGGLDTGAIANGTYHVWLIRRPDTGVVDVLFSASASSPSMPANYTQKAILGSILREGGVIVPFTQQGALFLRTTPVNDVNTGVLGTSAVLYTLTSIPSGVKFEAIIDGIIANASSGSAVLLTSPDQADVAAVSNAMMTAQHNNSGEAASFQTRLRVDTSKQIRARSSAANTGLVVVVHGWSDPRLNSI